MASQSVEEQKSGMHAQHTQWDNDKLIYMTTYTMCVWVWEYV